MRTFGFEMEFSKLINYLTDRQTRPEAAQKGLYGWWRACWDGPYQDFQGQGLDEYMRNVVYREVLEM